MEKYDCKNCIHSKKRTVANRGNVNIVRWIVKIYKVNHHNIEKKTNETTDLMLS